MRQTASSRRVDDASYAALRPRRRRLPALVLAAPTQLRDQHLIPAVGFVSEAPSRTLREHQPAQAKRHDIHGRRLQQPLRRASRTRAISPPTWRNSAAMPALSLTVVGLTDRRDIARPAARAVDRLACCGTSSRMAT